jgi:predicted nucleic acid-binding protein
MHLVLDASVATRVLLSTDDADAELWQRLREGICHAPHLVDAEAGSVLRRLTRQGAIEPGTAEAALLAIGSLVDNRYPQDNLAHTAWQLHHNLSYYDALYVALAARLGYPLLTADARLARAPGLPCAVELID